MWFLHYISHFFLSEEFSLLYKKKKKKSSFEQQNLFDVAKILLFRQVSEGFVLTRKYAWSAGHTIGMPGKDVLKWLRQINLLMEEQKLTLV